MLMIYNHKKTSGVHLVHNTQTICFSLQKTEFITSDHVVFSSFLPDLGVDRAQTDHLTAWHIAFVMPGHERENEHHKP